MTRHYIACTVNLTEGELAMILHLIYNKVIIQMGFEGGVVFFKALVIILTVHQD